LDEWDDVGGDGIVLRVAKPNTTERGREVVEDRKVEWGKRSREGGEVLVEGLVKSREL
jgi:hypothetical protein